MNTAKYGPFLHSILTASLLIVAAAGCNSSGFSAEPGDYQGVALYHSDDSSGYAHLAMTIADDHTVTGTAQIYDFPVGPGSVKTVPDGNYTYDVEGSTDGRNVSLTLTNVGPGTDIIVLSATVGDDGNISGDMLPQDAPTNWESTISIIPDSGDETAVACGGFGIEEVPPAVVVPVPSTEGAAVLLVTSGGDIHGIVASDDATGTINGSFPTGTPCTTTSCSSDVNVTFAGTWNGSDFSLTTETGSGIEFFPNADYPGDYTYAGLEVSMTGTDFNAGFGASTGNCYAAVVCGAGKAVCSASE